ncbi:MAG TPA: hypothetical protein VEB18_02685 [Candidatus Paceibacterota bacterium]|nr:hypothetical protein [Candidatus Paceibacterota bacterium]
MKTVILYHGSGCPDGFAAAYAAWKKFGDAAEYIALGRGDEPSIEAVRGATAYFLDFCYPKDIMDRFAETAERLVVLDHHYGVRDVIESMPEFVYDKDRSGAGIAWDYFHPGTPRPKLLDYIEDGDLFRFKYPETRAIGTYIEVQPYDFAVWDDIIKKFDNPASYTSMYERATIYAEYFEHLAQLAADHAKLVSFEGYEIYYGTAHPLKSMKSLVGNILARKHGPFALVVSAHPDGYGVSIRGDGSVDVAEIASRFGGNGHHDAAGFLIPREGPFPWTLLDDETSRD